MNTDKNKDLKSVLATVKALLFAEAPAETPTPEAPKAEVEFKGKDGKEYKTTELKAGSAITVKDGDKWNPAPDGAIELEDGSTIMVKEGKIEDVKPSAAPDAPKEEKAPAAFTAVAPTLEDFNALKLEVKALTDANALLVKAEATVNAKFAAMFELVEAYTNESVETPTVVVKSAFKAAITEKEAASKKLKDAMSANAPK